MQNIIVEKPYVFIPPKRSPFWPWLIDVLHIHDWQLSRSEGVTSHEIRHIEWLKDSIRAGHAVLLTPNHSRTADPVAMGWIARAANCHVYGMASWHLFQSRVNRFFLTGAGAFSIHREGVDRAAINYAVNLLEKAERPLVVFAEGTTTRTNDRLGALLDGVAFIARAAAKKRAKHSPPGKTVIHPVALKYLYQGNFEATAEEALTRIEQRLTWLPQTGLPFPERIRKIATALLSLKETEYFGAAREGTLAQRMRYLIDHLLGPHEKEWLGVEQSGPTVPRVRALRVKILPDMVQGRIDEAERRRRWKALADLYLAQQIDAYPLHYLSLHASTDRVLELIEKFEEDLFEAIRPKPPTKVVIEIGEAIEVSPERDRKASVDPLMHEIETRLQAMLDELALLSPRYHPPVNEPEKTA